MPYCIPAASSIGSRKGGIRNLSMKKFGTPTRAAPTVASEKLGLVGAGDPSEWVRTGAWTTGTGLCASSRAAAHSLAEVESEPEMTRSPHLTIVPAPEFE